MCPLNFREGPAQADSTEAAGSRFRPPGHPPGETRASDQRALGASLEGPRGWKPGTCRDGKNVSNLKRSLGKGMVLGARAGPTPGTSPHARARPGGSSLGRAGRQGGRALSWLQLHLARAARLLPGAVPRRRCRVTTTARRPRWSGSALGPTPCSVTSPTPASGTHWPQRKGSRPFFLSKCHALP